MKPPYYKITAFCIEHGLIEVERKTATYTNTAGEERPKANVKCPNCGLWAEIIKARKVVA